MGAGPTYESSAIKKTPFIAKMNSCKWSQKRSHSPLLRIPKQPHIPSEETRLIFHKISTTLCQLFKCWFYIINLGHFPLSVDTVANTGSNTTAIKTLPFPILQVLYGNSGNDNKAAPGELILPKGEGSRKGSGLISAPFHFYKATLVG